MSNGTKSLINLPQVGLSPKVKVPAIAALVGGAILVGVGLVIGEDVVTNLGIGALATVGVTVPAGYRAPTGEVELDVGEASDAVLGRITGQRPDAIEPTPPTEPVPPTE
jgi:hypothetical protein